MRTLPVSFIFLFAVTLLQAQPNPRFFIGSLTPGPTSLITYCELDRTTGRITQLDTTGSLKGPGYLSLSPDGKHLYAVTQTNEIVGFQVNSNGKLSLVNRQSSQGANPCYVSVHPSGRMAFVANYTGGSAAAFPITGDGQLQPATFVETYTGDGPSKPRQDKAHAHCALPSADGHYLFVTDLGTDRIMNYAVDVRRGTVQPNPVQPYFSTTAGSGPRHLAVHPSGKFVFVINELDATLSVLSLDKKGVLRTIQTVATLPPDFKEKNTAAAVRLHPNGRFVYVSNRGYNGITAFRIGSDGTLTQVDAQTQTIHTPRDFNLDPSGRFLLVANMGTDTISVFSVNADTGKLTLLNEGFSVSKPTCLVFQ
ncbi:lactonase family protein [Nibrella saemangeumensis]|uniref:Lactonase family protein n=1 Tax=Nibrella saemangeumensis TaxID=1084526 RepID=A0ABP8NHI4_9BACT